LVIDWFAEGDYVGFAESV